MEQSTGALPEICTIICTLTPSEEGTMTVVIPDACPDVVRVLDCTGIPLLLSRQIEDGELRLEGSVSCTALYLSEDAGRLCTLETTIPVSFRVRKEELLSTDLFTAALHLTAAEVRMVNSRKLQFKAEVCAEVCVFRRERPSFDPILPERADGLCLRREAREIGFVAAVSEKSFVVNEEWSLEDPESELLCCALRLRPGEIKFVGSKMILQGEAELGVLLNGQEKGPWAERFTASFSQILDAPECPDAEAAAVLTASSCYPEIVKNEDGGSLQLELHLAAQVILTGKTTVFPVTDAYCLRHDFEPCYSEDRCVSPFSAVRQKESVRLTSEMPEQPEKLLWARSEAYITAQGDQTVLCTAVRALCMTEEKELFAASASQRVPLERIDSGALCLPGSVRQEEPTASFGGEGLELTIPTEFSVLAARPASVRRLASVQIAPERKPSPENAPSIIAVRPCGATLWDLAKKYSSTEELIREFNPESVENDGSILLIPVIR